MYKPGDNIFVFYQLKSNYLSTNKELKNLACHYLFCLRHNSLLSYKEKLYVSNQVQLQLMYSEKYVSKSSLNTCILFKN